MLLALGAAINAVTYLWRARWREGRWMQLAAANSERSVALVIAVKGYDPLLTEPFFEGILTQGYSNYRVILTFESADDACLRWLREQLEIGPEVEQWSPEEGNLRSIDLVVAGSCEAHGCGQKVHNQRAAFERLDAEDEIIAFADADIRVDRDWLAKLVMPLNAGTHPISTTYRWLIPDANQTSWASDFASVMNASVATMGGCEWWNLTWGGSMALTRESFQKLDVPKLFEGSLNDDLRLGKYARSNGESIAFVQSLLIPSPIQFDWAKLIEFTRRQYYQVRHFAPITFGVSQFVHWIYPIGWLTALGMILFANLREAWIPVFVVTVADQIRGLFRQRIVVKLFSQETVAKLERTVWLEHLATPLWVTLHALLSGSAILMKRVTWAGITYRVSSESSTEVIERRTSS